MTAKIINGRRLTEILRAQFAVRVDALKSAGDNPPGLAVILVGDDAASAVYVRNKIKACEATGFDRWHTSSHRRYRMPSYSARSSS
jgi:methylenetetrahydrofolate dehydrogenase (NADP+)/methenyltetrahydrofolate cyclohydrolase